MYVYVYLVCYKCFQVRVVGIYDDDLGERLAGKKGCYTLPSTAVVPISVHIANLWCALAACARVWLLGWC